MKKESRLSEELLHYGSLGIEMLVAVVIGTLAGHWLDGRLHTGHWLMIIGFFLGAIAGFRSLLRLSKTEENNQTTKKNEN
ncbi:AtpZ/AtpI family protein [candidate division TA06 bacterium]|nr:AtpZ/AtpI family protein [candidate division TA06 bacterium]